VWCVGAMLVWPEDAAAFCRTMSCELGEDSLHPCPRDGNGCVTAGRPLHWEVPCLDYAVQLDGSPKSNLDADQIQAFVEDAFNAWKNVSCPGGGSPRFDVKFQGFVSCDRREAVCGGPEKNVNVVMFHDSGWLGGITHIGVTTPTGGTESGQVIDADVEINSQDYSFVSDPSGTMATSLKYVLTHELGHFLGLGHSSVSGALMSTNYQSLPLSPSLISADDAAAICAVYPPGRALTCNTPATPAYDACMLAPGEKPPCKLATLDQDVSSCGCRVAGRSRSPWSMLAALTFVTAALAARRRRRSATDGRAPSVAGS